MPFLTPTFFKQGDGETLADLPIIAGGPQRIRITHIVHPYVDRTVPLNTRVQDITFETMRMAAAMAAPHVAVRQVCVTLSDETALVPAGFIAAAPLTRTVDDIAAFAHRRALPLLFDILDNGVAVPEDAPPAEGCVDYIVYTNSDIHLQPTFYLAVANCVARGHDAITINRRTVPPFEASLADLPLMFGEHGAAHPGSDCFVFPRVLYGRFIRNDACVGASGVMRGLVANLASLSPRLLMLTAAHLTFHLGNDRYWQDPRFDDYRRFNLEQSKTVVTALASDGGIANKLLTFLRANREQWELIRAAERAMGLSGASFAARRLIRTILRPVLKPLRRRK